MKTLCKERNLCFRVVFNNSVVLDMDEKDSSILLKSVRQLNRRWGLTSVAGSIITALPHTLTHETEIMCGPFQSILNIEMEQDNVFKCVCVYLFPRIQRHTRTHTHTKPCCGQTHPSLVPHLENPKPKLMPLFFNYLSSHHRHHTKSI